MLIGGFGILLLLLVLGGGAAVLALIVFAVTSKRPGIAALVGVMAFFALLLGLGVLSLFVAAVQPVAIQAPSPVWAGGPMNDAARVAVHELQNFKTYSGGETFVAGGPTFSGILMFTAIVALIVIVVWRLISPRPACGRRKLWPALLAIPLIAMLVLGNVRYQVSRGYDAASASARQAADVAAAQQQAMIARQAAGIEAQVQQRIAQTDIHVQMDKFDAPRIPLPPATASPNLPEAPPAASATPAKQATVAKKSVEKASDTAPADSKETTAANEDKSQSKSKKDDTAKPTADSNRKRKKSDKTSGSSESKTSQAVAHAKPADESSGGPDESSDTKQKAAEHAKDSAVVAAKPDKPAAARPAWTNEPPKRTGNARREVIATEEYESVDECYQVADVYLLLKTYQHMQELAGLPYVEQPLPSLILHSGMILADGIVISSGGARPQWNDPRLRILNNMGIGTDYVRREIVAKDPNDNESREFIETVDRTFGKMKKLYLQIEFTPAVDRELSRHWDAYQRLERFAMVGFGAGSILSLLGFAFVLLKVDTWTKGYYTKRLFLGVPAAIIIGLLLMSLFTARVTRSETGVPPLPPGYAHSKEF